MEINNIIYGIILYIIIIASIVFMKPNFLYDHNKSKFKEFGTTFDKTIFTLPVLAIILAITISVSFATLSPKSKQNIQYIPVPYYQPAMPQYQFMYDPRIPQFSSSISPMTSPSNTIMTPAMSQPFNFNNLEPIRIK